MGVTDSGYCVLREQYTTKSEEDFPGQEWEDIADEIERSTTYTCTMIPVGGSEPVGTFTYSGRIYDLLCDDGLYYFDWRQPQGDAGFNPRRNGDRTCNTAR